MRSARQILAAVVLIAVILWCLEEAGQDAYRIRKGVPFLIRYLISMWPPDFSILPFLEIPIVESVRMAVAGIVVSTAVSVPVSFLAARNTAPFFSVYLTTRWVIIVLRGIPALLLALLFVSLAGLGPLPGILALTFHGIGVLSKDFSEVIESIGPSELEILEAMRVDGANEIQVLVHGLFPAVLPFFASHALSRFESNVRSASVLGLVGAGGLGIPLNESIQFFHRHETLTIVLVIFALAAAVDIVSRLLRARILNRTYLE